MIEVKNIEKSFGGIKILGFTRHNLIMDKVDLENSNAKVFGIH
jgi:hypothetical protein